MAWIQDSIISQEVPVRVGPAGEGLAEVTDVWGDLPEALIPGETYTVGGSCANRGAADNLRFVIGFMDVDTVVAEIEKIEEVWPDGAIYFQGELTLPATYTASTVYLIGIGYHEE